MTLFSRGLLAALLIFWTATTSSAADKAIIVLDASGSMWGQIDGKPKLEIARQTLRGVLQTIPSDLELGLMAYGHREKGSCEDIELLVPPQQNSASAISDAADSLKFLGKTPLSAAVKKAAEDLRYTEDKATVILITDGIETCSADPCALGKELEQNGIDFTAHVVGFGLTADEGREVACLAENTGGKYLQASDEAGLKAALTAAVAVAPEPAPAPAPAPAPVPEPAKPEFNFMPQLVMAAGAEPLTNAGNAWEIYKANADGTRGDRVTTEYNNYRGNLEPGDYVLRAILGEAAVEQPLKIEAGTVAEPTLVLNAGTLIVRPRPSEGADVSRDATVVTTSPSSSVATNYGETKIVLPAGETKLSVTIGSGEASETITLAAGQTIEKDIVVGVGHVVVNALYAAGADKVDSSNLDIKIFRAARKIDGSREQVTYAFGADAKFDLAPGDYVAVVQMDQASVEQPFNIRVAEAKDVTAILDAGVLSISAPGARHIEVFAAKKDIQGNRRAFGYAFAETHQTTLPAGEYVVIADREAAGGKTEATATVKAGERTEVAVP